MGFQQICRFRIGDQEAGAGYQICGLSEGITPDVSDEFSNNVKTIRIKDADISRPPVIDWSSDKAGKNYYLVTVSPRVDGTMGRRPTPLSHGIVIEAEEAKKLLGQPGKFMAFSSTDFITQWNASDLTIHKLEELETLDTDEKYQFSLRGIKEKYQLSERQFTNLLYHVYEVILSEGRIPQLTFVWNGDKESYLDVIRDMMYVVYRMIPSFLKTRITFSSDYFDGMLSRQFTVSDRAAGNSWFNLNTGESGSLEDINEETKYRYAYIEYLGQHVEDETAEELIEWMDEFAQRIYRRPDLKNGAALTNVLSAVFVTWREEIADTYYKVSEIVRVVHSMALMKVDDREFLDEKTGELLFYAVKHKANINDTQLANIQKLYTTTESDVLRTAYQLAVASKDLAFVFKALLNTLKDESSKVADEFIEILLKRLPVSAKVQTPEVMGALEKRYYVTPNEYLQVYYLDYIRRKFESNLTEDQIEEILLPALEKLTCQEEETYRRASNYLKGQLQKLEELKRQVPDPVFDKLVECYDFLRDKELKNSVMNYVTSCYMLGNIEQAVSCFERLRISGGGLYTDIDKWLRDHNSEILDHHFAEKVYRSMERGDIEEQKKALRMASGLPLHEESFKKIIDRVEIICLDAMKEEQEREDTDEALATRLQKVYMNLYEHLSIFNSIEDNKRLQDALFSIVKKCQEFYWDAVKIGAKGTRECLKCKGLECKHPKRNDMKEYYRILDELTNSINSVKCIVSDEAAALLTTNRYIGSPKKRDCLIEKYLGILKSKDPRYLDVNTLLVVYYENESERLSGTSFLRGLTSEQWHQLGADIYMLREHPKLRETIMKFRKKRSKKAQSRFFRNGRIKMAAIIGSIVMILAIVAVSAILISKSFSKPEEEDMFEPETVLIEQQETSGTPTVEVEGKGSDEDSALLQFVQKQGL